jgi:hypothetical protein
MRSPMIQNETKSGQPEFFAILEEFFQRATGKSPQEFATFDSFGDEIHKNATALGKKGPDAFRFAWESLPKFYETNKVRAFEEAKHAAGLKFVLGGSSRFGETHFDSVRKMLLYADTILIPDPVLPWMESARREERFRDVLLIKAAFGLLHLKPLIDASLPFPAVIVFQSWEKSLETHDPKTQVLINQFLLDVLSIKLGAEFGDLAEIAQFASQRPEQFLKTVESQGLFVGPNCTPGQSLHEHLNEYRKTIAEWRSAEEQKRATDYSDSELVLQGLLERLVPQYHLLENAEEMGSNPMLCIPSQWHYYATCATAFEERLKRNGLLQPETIASVKAINQPGLNWLGNIPIQDLVRLRIDNENQDFRQRLGDMTGQLHQAVLGDLDKLTNEISKNLSALLSEHSKNLRQQAEEFQTKYKIVALGACVTLAAVLLPFLAPFGLPASAAAVGLGYGGTKIEELAKRKQKAKSLLGILAAAKEDESSN